MIDQSEIKPVNEVVGVILAGGQSRRFGGGDKYIKELGKKPLIEHVIDRVRPQTKSVVINSNNQTTFFGHENLPVISDTIPGYVGPLAGVLAGMEWVIQHLITIKWIVTFPSDAPFIPLDCVDKMIKKADKSTADIVCVASNNRSHPVCALWSVALASDLRKSILQDGVRKIDLWTQRYNLSTVNFSAEPFDPFFNINKPEDLKTAQKILQVNWPKS